MGCLHQLGEQNPVTAERLMRIVDDERSWDHERREAAGGLSRVAKHRIAPMGLQQFYTATDLNRLFDWLKAQRDLKEFGLDIDLPSKPRGEIFEYHRSLPASLQSQPGQSLISPPRRRRSWLASPL